MLSRKLNSPLTSSVGRLFDAVASLLDLKQRSHFEGQAAMALEFGLPEHQDDSAYGFSVTDAAVPGHFVVDWAAVIESVLRDQRDRVGSAIISSKFHRGLVECIMAVAQRVGCPRVALSGGCFQNRYLLECSVQRLRGAGFQPYWHQRVPPNDGGISFGQAVAALRGIV
jgi:hydrogenase maturation protein HypF